MTKIIIHLTKKEYIILITLLIIFNYINKISRQTTSDKLDLNSVRKEIIFYSNINFTHFSINSFSKVKNPKISIIITLYNQKEYIKKIYSCILNQSLKQVEIIFIDDASIDNSFLDVEKLMNTDKRIIYIKNKKNKGQFYSRNRGVLHSNGKYVIVIDPDDFLVNNILYKSYKFAIKYNLDIVQFYHLMGNIKENTLEIINNKSGIFFQPETNKIFFECETRYLWDKLIRRMVFVKSINFMDKKFRNERFIIHNDETACFGIFKSAYSYGQIKEIGYFYNKANNNSITKKNFYPKNINGRFHSIFSIMDYYYDQSENNKYEKTKGGYHFFELRIVPVYKNRIKYLTEGFKYINNVLNKYIDSPFFNSTQKRKLRIFKNIIDIQNLKQQNKRLNLSLSHKNVNMSREKNNFII